MFNPDLFTDALLFGFIFAEVVGLVIFGIPEYIKTKKAKTKKVRKSH